MNDLQRGIIVKGRFFLALMLLLGLTANCVYSADKPIPSKRLILNKGFILSAYYNDRYIELKRLSSPHQYFYGFGWLDKDKVFIAYQDEGGEAYADMEIIDLHHDRTTKLKEGIGGVGEAVFDVNPITGVVVYSTGEDINLIKIDLNTMTYKITTLKKGNYWGAFWIDSKTIGCKLFNNDGDSSFVKFSIP